MSDLNKKCTDLEGKQTGDGTSKNQLGVTGNIEARDINQSNKTFHFYGTPNFSVNSQDQVPHLRRNLDQPSSNITDGAIVADLNEKLKNLYEDLQLPVVPWMADAFPLDEYYIPLQLNSVRRRATSNETAHSNGMRETTQLDTQSQSKLNYNQNVVGRDSGIASYTKWLFNLPYKFYLGVRKMTQLGSQSNVSCNQDINGCQPITDDRKRAINLEDMFEPVDGINPKRILVEGQPGLGKTTLAHKIMHDWRKEKNFTKRFDFALPRPLRYLWQILRNWRKEENYTKRFDYALLIPLRHLREKTLREEILKRLDVKDNDKVWNLINRGRTLLVLDGLDEVDESGRENILKVLYDKVGSKMMIVVTCRSGLFKLDENEKNSIFLGVAKSNDFWDKKIEILGFDDESRKIFLEKFLKDENHDIIVEKITEMAKQDMLRSPLILILLSFILVDDETFTITTITELYKKLVDCIIKRSVSKDEKIKLDENFTVFENVMSGEYKANLCKFGEISIDHILNDNLQFECDDFTKLIYGMGFLLKHETRKNKFSKALPHYEGYHLTFLEFAAAFSLWVQFKKDGNEFTHETLYKINKICFKKGSLSMILPFLCGLIGGDVKKLFNQLRSFRPLYLDEYLMWFILRECEASDEVCEILAIFFPEVVNISWYEILFLRNKVLTKHIVLMNVDCNELLTLAQLGNIYIELINVRVSFKFLIDLYEKLDSTRSVSCKNLFINVMGSYSRGDDSCGEMADQLRFLLNDVPCRHKHLRVEVHCGFNLINECVENKIITNQTLDSLYGYLTHEQISIDLLINIFKYNTVKRLEIFVYSNSDLNNLYKIFHLLRPYSLTSVLILFTYAVMKPNPQVDLNNVTRLQFDLQDVMFMVAEVNNECNELFEIIGDCSSYVETLCALKPKELQCSYMVYDRLMLDPKLLSWTVTNLTLDIWNRSLETLSCLGKLTALKKMAFCVNDTLDRKQQHTIVECLLTLTLDQLQFVCNGDSLVTDIVNGIKDLREKNELISIGNIDFRLAYDVRWEVNKHLEFLSALREALLSDIRMTAHFSTHVHDALRFRELFAIFNIFDLSQFEVQQTTRILSCKSEFMLNLNFPYGSVLKIQKKNTFYG